MANQTERPRYWPLVPGGLTADELKPFAPLSFNSLAAGRSLGFLEDSELREIIRKGLTKSAPDLALFLDSAMIFDRDRDISDELSRLSALDSPQAPPLWAIMGRIIVDEYPDPDDAVATLEQLYQWFDHPPELRPYTLYVGSEDGGYSTTQQGIKAFDKFLRSRGLLPRGSH